MAATAGTIRAGRAFIEFFAKDSTKAGLRRISAKLKAFGTGVRTIGTKILSAGAAMSAPFATSATIFAKLGDSTAKMAKRIGISVEALTQLTFAAERSGATATELESGMRHMATVITDAAAGGKAASAVLRNLGLTAEQLVRLTPDQQFTALADALAQIQDPTQRAAFALQIFGRAGTRLLPLVGEGAKGIAALRAEADRLGLTMAGDDAAAAEVFNDHLGDLWAQLKMVAFQVGAVVAPALTEMLRAIAPIIKSVIDWIKANKLLIASVAAIAVGVSAAGGLLIGIGGTLSALGASVGAVVAIGSKLAAVFAFIGLKGAIVIGTIASAAYAFATMTKTGRQAVAALFDAFKSFAADVSGAWNAIVNAIKSGDLAAAAKIAGALLKLEWVKLTNFLETTWLRMKHAVLATVADLGVSIAKRLNDWLDLNALARAMFDVFAWIEKRLTEFVGFVREQWAAFITIFDESEGTWAAQKARIQADVDKQKAAIDKRKELAKAAIGTVIDLNDDERLQGNVDAFKAGLNAALAAAVKEQEAGLAEARRELERLKAETENIAPMDDPTAGAAQDFRAKLPSIRDAVESLSARVTFSSAAALRGVLSGGDASEDLVRKQVDLLQEIADNTAEAMEAGA